mmetsp:Transcript_41141/g.131628  ORF Transcript_41141/g.131628 Transcript_41141/m.131628 type:complete len:221 (-) Transcript_41141:479-1141(-)
MRGSRGSGCWGRRRWRRGRPSTSLCGGWRGCPPLPPCRARRSNGGAGARGRPRTPARGQWAPAAPSLSQAPSWTSCGTTQRPQTTGPQTPCMWSPPRPAPSPPAPPPTGPQRPPRCPNLRSHLRPGLGGRRGGGGEGVSHSTGARARPGSSHCKSDRVSCADLDRPERGRDGDVDGERPLSRGHPHRGRGELLSKRLEVCLVFEGDRGECDVLDGPKLVL